MTGTPDAKACGFYGKLPTKGDFVTRRLPPGFVAAWDAWLQDGMTVSRERFGEGWLDAYLVAPIWRFVLPAGLLDPSAVAGVLMPSMDRVGRYFPFTIAVLPDGAVSPVRMATTADGWFASAEGLAVLALEEGLDFDRFDAEVAALGSPTVPAGAKPTVDPCETWMLPLESASAVGQGLALIADEILNGEFGTCSVWWTAGSACVDPSLVVRRGMPTAADFPALIDGLWLSGREASPDEQSDPEKYDTEEPP